jgi:phosphatidate cytidylyltransferase
VTIRIATGAVSIPLFLAVAWTGGWLFACAIALLAAGGAWEYARLLEKRGQSAPRAWMIAGSATVPLLAHGVGLVLWPVLLLAVAAHVTTRVRGGRPSRFVTVVQGVFAVTYVAGTLSHLVLLRDSPDGLYGVLLVFLLTWSCDTAAYAIGSVWGRHRPWPTISPSKSLEGAIAGLVAPLLVAVLVRRWLFPAASPAMAAGLGTLAGACAQLGDLVESSWKRAAGVKDSSALLPGHGGILDRFDSMMWSAPLAYYVLRTLQI